MVEERLLLLPHTVTVSMHLDFSCYTLVYGRCYSCFYDRLNSSRTRWKEKSAV